MTASIGGAPLTDITVGQLHLVPGHHHGAQPGRGTVSVSTAAGTKAAPAFAYSYGITVSPNTAPNTGSGATFFLDVLGAGFDALAA